MNLTTQNQKKSEQKRIKKILEKRKARWQVMRAAHWIIKFLMQFLHSYPLVGAVIPQIDLIKLRAVLAVLSRFQHLWSPEYFCAQARYLAMVRTVLL